MKTLLTTIAATAMLTGSAFAIHPNYSDMNRDGVVTQSEYEAYAFDRADTDDSHSIEPNERMRYERLMDLDQEF